MKTKIVYTLISDSSDFYYEQLLLSLYSLRVYNQEATVLIVVDEETNATFGGNRQGFRNLINSIIVVNCPKQYNKTQRSRFLKTSLRKVIEGDFLYIDTDTIICHALADIDLIEAEIAAVLDNHHGEIIDWQVEQSPEELGWKYLAGSKHFCGGVIYAKDTFQAHSFFQEWHENWCYSASFNCNYDQLGLRKTVLESGISVKELDGIWNCQVMRDSSKPFLQNAQIIHYQGASFDFDYKICSKETFLTLKLNGTITEEIKTIIRLGHSAFLKRSVYLSESDYLYLKSPMKNVYHDYPSFFSALLKLSDIYRCFISSAYRLKRYLFQPNI